MSKSLTNSTDFPSLIRQTERKKEKEKQKQKQKQKQKWRLPIPCVRVCLYFFFLSLSFFPFFLAEWSLNHIFHIFLTYLFISHLPKIFLIKRL